MYHFLNIFSINAKYYLGFKKKKEVIEMAFTFIKNMLLITLLLYTITIYGQRDYIVTFEQPSEGVYQLNFDVIHWSVQPVVYDDVQYQQIIFNNSIVTDKKGWAELPIINASIQLPAQKNVDLNVIYTDYSDYQLDFPLVPSKGVIYRNQNPSAIPYQIDATSIVNRFYPGELAIAGEPYIVRDVRGISVRVFPFQYNAATNILRIYNKMKVLLTENEQSATNPLLNENPTPVKEVVGMYQSLFLNYNIPKIELPITQHGEILVIATQRDSETIDTYIQWKKEKGFIVHKEIVASGTNVKMFIQQKYNENNNLLYVQLVGDWEDIQSDLGGGEEQAPTDPAMGCVVGTDDFPDIAIGRFSCKNEQELLIQINKAIDYEKNPNIYPDWYKAFIGIASEEGPGDDGELDYIHIQRIYTQRLQPFTYHTHYQNYEPEAHITMLTSHINEGASAIAYCGHGSSTSWGTTGFGNDDIEQLTNGNKLPFIVSVACGNGAFHNTHDCFGEAWLKKENGGAIVTWMSSISQPWSPPMRGQDYFFDILTGGFNYAQYPGQNGITTNEQRTIWGALTVNAGNLMLTENPSISDVETVHTWTTFGDVALQLRTKQPDLLASSMQVFLEGTPFSTTITVDDAPIKGALVCISQNGVYHAAFTNEEGMVNIENQFVSGEVLLVVTAFNTTTIYESIECVPAEGSYIIYDSYTVVGEKALTYISVNSEIEVTLKNIGVAPTTGVLTVTISCDDSQLIINNATAQCASINVGETATVKFRVTIANNIPDNKIFPVTVTVTEGVKKSWNSNMPLKAYAPRFSLEKILINNGEHLEPGTTAMITATIINKGRADAYAVQGDIKTNDEYLIFACEKELNNGKRNLPAGESMDFTSAVIVSQAMPAGHQADMNLLLKAKYELAFTAPFTISSSDYCKPGLSNCTVYNDRLTYVKFAEIDHEPACSSTGYSNYTDMTAILMPGQQYTITVKVGYGYHQVKGWIDLNGNKILDDNENMIDIFCNSENTEYSQTITIPEDAVPGTHRFRLRTQYETESEACGGYSWGQTLDYSVVISEVYPRVRNVVAVLDKEKANITITWEAPEGETPIGYNIYRNGDGLNSALLTDRNFTEYNLSESIYIYNIAAVFANNKESVSEISNIVCFFTPNLCEEPVNLAGTAEKNTAIIIWDEPENINGELLGYNIYRDGTPINGILYTEQEYRDENLSNGTYLYQVSAVYEHCEESKWTEGVSVKIDDTNINNLQTDSFQIFPNPAHNELNIKGNIVPTSVCIYNITGQLLYETTQCATHMSISVSFMPTGIYFVRINSEYGNVMKKVIVE